MGGEVWGQTLLERVYLGQNRDLRTRLMAKLFLQKLCVIARYLFFNEALCCTNVGSNFMKQFEDF